MYCFNIYSIKKAINNSKNHGNDQKLSHTCLQPYTTFNLQNIFIRSECLELLKTYSYHTNTLIINFPNFFFQYELDLPIEVKVGVIGKISLNIPWTGLYTQSVIVSVEVRILNTFKCVCRINQMTIINFRICYMNLMNSCEATDIYVALLQDVYIIAGPVLDRKYDPEKEKRLSRSAKKKKLEDLEVESLLGTGKNLLIIY